MFLFRPDRPVSRGGRTGHPGEREGGSVKATTRFYSMLVAAALLAGSAAQSHAYWGLKGGIFLPNIQHDGFGDFGSGPVVEVFAGLAVGRADLELDAGGYESPNKVVSDDQYQLVDLDGASVRWITFTGKLSAPLGKFLFYGGGGAGYYSATVFDYLNDPDIFLDGLSGSGVGVHLVAGLECSLGRFAPLVEVKWVSVKPDLEVKGPTQMGGLVLSAGVLF